MNSRLSFPVRMVLVFIAVLTAAVIVSFLLHPESNSEFGGDFTLEHETGPWRFADHARELNLLYFGYVNCPDICPLRMARISQALEALSTTEREEILPIFISVDNEHDKAQDVAAFARHFAGNFIGLTGSTESLNQVAGLFGATYSKNLDAESQLGYTYMHTDRIYFLNQDGKVMTSLVAPDTSAEVLKKLKELL